MITDLNYNFFNLADESELRFIGGMRNKSHLLPHILRGGLPQGLSMSPILSTLAIEFVDPIKEVTMYADDGLYVGQDHEEFYY
jgi:hypothetical protein